MSSQVSVDVIGVPFDLCGKISGSRLGPAALRLRQLSKDLRDLGHSVTDRGDVVELEYSLADSYASKMAQAQAMYSALAEQVETSIKNGSTPVVLGGDHSLSIGSVSGALKACGRDDLAVIWVDAHMDLNNPETSPSGNFHGMPLAALCRLDKGSTSANPEAPQVWDKIQEDVVPNPGLRTDRVAWIGLRDVDPGEIKHYNGFQGESAWAMQDIDHLGMPGVLDELDAWLRKTGAKKVWISFDVDSLDPVLAPGTGTAVRGGLTYREGHLLAELLFEMLFRSGSAYTLAGVDLVEVNPMEDAKSNTAIAAVEWICSLFGKRTMVKRIND
ncbi:MAG: arginase [Fimbriimonadaceae bacterium]|nr:arginase [Fimbriimonadaceae bacterium]